MADEYIRRQEMLDAVEKLNIIPSIDGTGKPTPTEDFRVQFLGTVLHVSSADVVPVIHSHWTLVGWHKGMKVVECFKCKCRAIGSGNFCPNCGAKMDAR